MRKRIGFLKNAIASTTGYFSPSGEKLVSARLTQEQADAFNGKKKSKKTQSEVAAVQKAARTYTPRAKKEAAAPVVVAEEVAVAAPVEEVAAPAPAAE
jgi:hypothetical protein